MERVSGVRCADLSYSVTLTAGAGGYDYTDSVGDWTPKVGDLVARATEPAASYAFVTATDGTNFDLSAALSNGAGTAYDSYESVIEWVAKTARDPLTTKFWRSIGLWWESLFGATSAYQYSVGFKTENRPTTDTADVQVVSLVRNPDTTQFAAAVPIALGALFEPTTIQSYVPRNYAIGATLRPRIELRQAGVCWALSSLSVDGETIGNAHRRTYASG
jgi:hypothetical protein